MLDPTQVRFPHRTNANGSFDSICTNCFETVARSFFEPDLTLLEQTHVCRQSDLIRLGKLEIDDLPHQPSSSAPNLADPEPPAPSTTGNPTLKSLVLSA